MRKAERLFQIINLLRGRRTVVTAQTLAEALDVSERTIYRDIQALSLSGVPIEGEAGVGYRLQRQFDLPPLMFDEQEVEALLVGARMAIGWSDKGMAGAAASALQKILAVLPEELREKDRNTPIYTFEFEGNQHYTAFKEPLRDAIRSNKVVELNYRDAKENISLRTIEPLGLVFWGKIWTLVAHCQLRKDYRMFRLDRIIHLSTCEEGFTTSSHKSMDHYLSLQKDKCEGQAIIPEQIPSHAKHHDKEDYEKSE